MSTLDVNCGFDVTVTLGPELMGRSFWPVRRVLGFGGAIGRGPVFILTGAEAAPVELVTDGTVEDGGEEISIPRESETIDFLGICG